MHEKDLHFQFTKAADGKILLRTKTQMEALFWSEPFCMFKDTPSGIKLSDIGNNVVVDIPLPELALMTNGVNSCSRRISPEDYQQCTQDLLRLHNTEPTPFDWEDGGVFKSEQSSLVPDESSSGVQTSAPMPAISSLATNFVAYDRRLNSLEDNQVCMGTYVAVLVNWTGDPSKLLK